MALEEVMNAKSSAEVNPGRILILGLGDLGVEIARLVVEHRYSSACLLAGQSGRAQQWAQLLQISNGRDVQAARVDGQDVEALKKLFADFEPDAIIQCATLISPYAFAKTGTSAAMAILKGGFALQMAAQLPIIRSVMQARQALGLRCPVINCSYPDATNPMLATAGLAPSAGIGNVAIMAMRFARLIRGAGTGTFHVVGHHSQLGPSLAGNPAPGPMPTPLVYLDGRKLDPQELLLKTGLEAGPTLNHLAAATVLPILHGFLARNSVTETHAPGVLGLPGGYPVRFAGGEVELRLPKTLSMADAIMFNKLSAAGDGIDRIEEDGTLIYTNEAKEAVASWCPELAEPFGFKDLEKRLALLRSIH
jgi:hypothetical protein